MILQRFRTRRQWLSYRKHFIGASESAAILGVGYASESAVTVWYSKRHGAKPPSETPEMRSGRMFQDGILKMFVQDTGIAAKAWPLCVALLHDKPHIGATLDATTPEGYPVELKFQNSHSKASWKDEPPLRYVVQLQHQMLVTGQPEGWLYGIVDGQPRSYRLMADEAFHHALLERLDAFWQCVSSGRLPQIDGSAETARVLNMLHSDVAESTVNLPNEAIDWADTIATAEAVISTASESLEKCRNLLRAAIGEHSIGLLPDGRVYGYKKHGKSRMLKRIR